MTSPLELLNDTQDLIKETLGKYTVSDLGNLKIQDHLSALYAAEAYLAEDLKIAPFMRQPKGLERLIHPSYV